MDIAKWSPATFTIVALEEPENSLSPHYIGRVLKSLRDISTGHDAQALVATQAPALLRRVAPESIRYLRLSATRETCVTSIQLPPAGDDAHKFVREAVQAFPELYFSRLVVLGEGDSEEIVLPRMLAVRGMESDQTAISVVPLSGRFVHHFWRLLHALGIPYLTLLDLDTGRFGGGWGRIRYACAQLKKLDSAGWAQVDVENLPEWDQPAIVNQQNPNLLAQWITHLRTKDVFFSSPLDLDLMMLEAYVDVAALPHQKAPPTSTEFTAILGKKGYKGDNVPNQFWEGSYTAAQRQLFQTYVDLFLSGSKPVTHIELLSAMTDQQIGAHLPEPLAALLDRARAMIQQIPE